LLAKTFLPRAFALLLGIGVCAQGRNALTVVAFMGIILVDGGTDLCHNKVEKEGKGGTST